MGRRRRSLLQQAMSAVPEETRLHRVEAAVTGTRPRPRRVVESASFDDGTRIRVELAGRPFVQGPLPATGSRQVPPPVARPAQPPSPWSSLGLSDGWYVDPFESLPAVVPPPAASPALAPATSPAASPAVSPATEPAPGPGASPPAAAPGAPAGVLRPADDDVDEDLRAIAASTPAAAGPAVTGALGVLDADGAAFLRRAAVEAPHPAPVAPPPDDEAPIGGAAPAPAPEGAAAHPHEMFERLGRRMSRSTSFDLGDIALTHVLDRFDDELRVQEGEPRPPAALALSEEDIAADLVEISAQPAAAPTPAAPAAPPPAAPAAPTPPAGPGMPGPVGTDPEAPSGPAQPSAAPGIPPAHVPDAPVQAGPDDTGPHATGR
ncbi:hypothetical protein ACI79C_14160 [Geodermatophilus sp. SYSU D00697]